MKREHDAWRRNQTPKDTARDIRVGKRGNICKTGLQTD